MQLPFATLVFLLRKCLGGWGGEGSGECSHPFQVITVFPNFKSIKYFTYYYIDKKKHSYNANLRVQHRCRGSRTPLNFNHFPVPNYILANTRIHHSINIFEQDCTLMSLIKVQVCLKTDLYQHFIDLFSFFYYVSVPFTNIVQKQYIQHIPYIS